MLLYELVPCASGHLTRLHLDIGIFYNNHALISLVVMNAFMYALINIKVCTKMLL